MPYWQWLAGALALALIGWRILQAVRRGAGMRSEDWDEKLVRNLRAQTSDPFKPQELDFFFSPADEPACRRFAADLGPLGYTVDYKAAGADSIGGYTLHARKSMPIAVAAVQGAVAELRTLAARHGVSYDGWAAAGMTRPDKASL